jgi:CubicO group peptidase (beta-lactamase class C family)
MAVEGGVMPLGRNIVALLFTPLLLAAAPARPNAAALATAALRDRSIPAIGIVLIRHGRIADEAVAGVRSRGSSAPVRKSDLWHIGSDEKAMTATLIARLVERGALSWDTPLSRLIPELSKSMRADYRNVNLKELLAHRAGLQDLIDSDYYERLYHDRRPLHAQRVDYVRMALSWPPAFRPGTDAKYSNRGTVIAALAAEDSTGRGYEVLMRREVFAPLGMRSPRFDPPHRGELAGHDGEIPKYGLHADNPRVDAPAGEVRLTLNDWARFAIDQMEGDHGKGRLLRKSTYALLHTGQAESIYGLGWGVRQSLDGVSGRFLTHSGSNGYWFARIVLAPDKENGLLVVTSSAGMGAQKAVSNIETAIVPTLND